MIEKAPLNDGLLLQEKIKKVIFLNVTRGFCELLRNQLCKKLNCTN